MRGLDGRGACYSGEKIGPAKVTGLAILFVVLGSRYRWAPELKLVTMPMPPRLA